MAEYIKRETVIKHLRECEGTPPEIGYTYPIFKALECFIEEVPAVDVVEVVHGRWKFYCKDYSKCSQCGFGRNIKSQFGWHYCPNCGAKMDRKDDT